MWILIGTVWVIDALWLWAEGIALAPLSVCYTAIGAGFLCTIAYLYRRRALPISYCAEVGAQMGLFSVGGGILTYLAVTLAAPLADAEFVFIDQKLGFDWMEWFIWVNNHQFLRSVFGFAYASTGPQIILCWLWLSLRGKRDILQEFLWAAMVSLLISTSIYAALPAKGPWVFFDTGLYADWIEDFIALRNNAMPVLDCRKIVGIVVCPSYHTALGVIFIAIARSNRWLLAGSVLLNGTMILSVVTEGSHYLIDVVSGATVAIISIFTVALVRRRALFDLAWAFELACYCRKLDRLGWQTGLRKGSCRYMD
jgi:hypothetical protein